MKKIHKQYNEYLKGLKEIDKTCKAFDFTDIYDIFYNTDITNIALETSNSYEQHKHEWSWVKLNKAQNLDFIRRLMNYLVKNNIVASFELKETEDSKKYYNKKRLVYELSFYLKYNPNTKYIRKISMVKADYYKTRDFELNNLMNCEVSSEDLFLNYTNGTGYEDRSIEGNSLDFWLHYAVSIFCGFDNHVNIIQTEQVNSLVYKRLYVKCEDKKVLENIEKNLIKNSDFDYCRLKIEEDLLSFSINNDKIPIVINYIFKIPTNNLIKIGTNFWNLIKHR